MAETITFRTELQEQEARMVAGMATLGQRTQFELYSYCADYFWRNYKGVFFADEHTAADILQNTFITFWENIERRKIYVSDCRIFGIDDKPLKGSILTYFMGIARIKHLEWVRQNMRADNREGSIVMSIDGELCNINECIDLLYDKSQNVMLDIIADLISQMPPRCSEILTKFYYEEKSLETILAEIPSIESKDALKTRKHKCIKELRNSANEIYNRYLNS